MLVLVTVFVGFARTYYLAGMFNAPLPNWIIHIHGAVFSAWILLLIAQTSLVAAGRVDLHRRLGLVGFGLACLVVILGLVAATDELVRHYSPGEQGAGSRIFYAVPVADMLVFGTLIYLGFRNRFKPTAHKRLILIATVMIMVAAIVRWPIHAAWWNLQMAQISSYTFLLLLVCYDVLTTRMVHRVTLWASAFLIVMQQVRIPIGHTVIWQSFATLVQNLARRLY